MSSLQHKGALQPLGSRFLRKCPYTRVALSRYSLHLQAPLLSDERFSALHKLSTQKTSPFWHVPLCEVRVSQG